MATRINPSQIREVIPLGDPRVSGIVNLGGNAGGYSMILKDIQRDALVARAIDAYACKNSLSILIDPKNMAEGVRIDLLLKADNGDIKIGFSPIMVYHGSGCMALSRYRFGVLQGYAIALTLFRMEEKIFLSSVQEGLGAVFF